MAGGSAAKNIVAVDAPVSEAWQVPRRRLWLYCDDQTFATVKPVVEVIVDFLASAMLGQGQTMKLLNNWLPPRWRFCKQRWRVMGVKAGLDAKQVIDVINAGSGRNT